MLDANVNPTGAEVGFVRVADIRPDVPYYFSVEAIDSESGRSVRSQEVPFTVASTPFTLAAQQTTIAVAAGGSASVPVTLNAGDPLFFPNVWLSTDLGNTPPGITSEAGCDAEGFPGLSAGVPT